MLAVGAVISGAAGVVVVGAALGMRYLLRARPQLCDAVTVGTAAGGLILAGVVLSQNPWRSVDGYVGHSAGVQLLALISVGALAASAVTTPGAPQDTRCFADDFGPPRRDRATGLRSAMKIAHLRATLSLAGRQRRYAFEAPDLEMPQRWAASSDITSSTIEAALGLRDDVAPLRRPNATQ